MEMRVRLLQRVCFTKGVFLPLLTGHAAWYGAVILLDALRYLPVNTRSSPERRVMPLSSKYSNKGMAYLRVVPTVSYTHLTLPTICSV